MLAAGTLATVLEVVVLGVESPSPSTVVTLSLSGTTNSTFTLFSDGGKSSTESA